jgi:hypothetical protein
VKRTAHDIVKIGRPLSEVKVELIGHTSARLAVIVRA